MVVILSLKRQTAYKAGVWNGGVLNEEKDKNHTYGLGNDCIRIKCLHGNMAGLHGACHREAVLTGDEYFEEAQEVILEQLQKKYDRSFKVTDMVGEGWGHHYLGAAVEDMDGNCFGVRCTTDKNSLTIHSNLSDLKNSEDFLNISFYIYLNEKDIENLNIENMLYQISLKGQKNRLTGNYTCFIVKEQEWSNVESKVEQDIIGPIFVTYYRYIVNMKKIITDE